MAAHQAPPSLGFSRQEHWSGLPFPSPMDESEKWKWSRLVVSWLLATPRTAAYQTPPSMGFSRQEYWSGVPLPSPILPCKFLKIWEMHELNLDDARWEGRLLQKTQRVMGWGGRWWWESFREDQGLKEHPGRWQTPPEWVARKIRERDVHMTSWGKLLLEGKKRRSNKDGKCSV